jgi:flagellar hook assembly protein FlgD
VLLSGKQPAGRHAPTWDGRDNQGRILGRGIYCVRFESGSFRNIEKLIKLD